MCSSDLRSSLYWHMSDPRRMTLSDQHPRIFICSTTHYGAFPHAFFSLDALLLKNGALSPMQRLKFLGPTLSYLILFWTLIELKFICLWIVTHSSFFFFPLSIFFSLFRKIWFYIQTSSLNYYFLIYVNIMTFYNPLMII